MATGNERRNLELLARGITSIPCSLTPWVVEPVGGESGALLTLAMSAVLVCESEGMLGRLVECLDAGFGLRLWTEDTVQGEIMRQTGRIMEERDSLKSENETLRMALASLKDDGKERRT